MSKLNSIDKRRFHSFLIYILVSVWFLYGCATKSSVGMNASEADSQSQIAHVNTDHSSTRTVPEEKTVTETAEKAAETKAAEPVATQKDTEEKEYTESKPRIFFKPSGSKLGQILGIDFSMMPQGKSRLTVTTNEEVKYDIDRVNANTLTLNFHDSKISNELLLRYIDTTQFQTPLEEIKPIFDKDKNVVSLRIVMREVVPYHILQSKDSLIMDFGKISSPVAEKKITPLNLVEAKTEKLSAVADRNTAGVTRSSVSPGNSQAEIQAFSPSVSKKYTGEPLYLDFDDADVTNILKLINDVSKENIIWDPAIKGKKVSMRLHDVPWDEALDLILKNNELAKRYVGENIVWITTKQKMTQILAEEEAQQKKLDQQLEQERQKIIDQKKLAEDNAPLVTEYLPIDFSTADEIKKHIITSKRGTISTDKRTNTIIMNDTAESIKQAKKIVQQFDTPVRQVIIEARIVDATDNFSRDLGLRWNSATSAYRSNLNSVTSGTLPVPTTPNESVYGGAFSTNAPSPSWGQDGMLGLNFARLTSSGRGSITLDATLALAESQGIAKTLSAPKIIAQEGEEAVIKSGQTVYTNPTENVGQQSRDAALTLNVTPKSISYNGYITLNMHVTDNKNVSPTLDTTKEINTMLTIKSGETVVIGGILKESESADTTGVPVLKDIPGVGWLFKAKTKTHEKSELLIFLTPTVVPAPVKNY